MERGHGGAGERFWKKRRWPVSEEVPRLMKHMKEKGVRKATGGVVGCDAEAWGDGERHHEGDQKAKARAGYR